MATIPNNLGAMNRSGISIRLLLAVTIAASSLPALSAPITIVAIGASNTWGWGVGSERAYPALLQAMLKARGYDVDVRNAGVNFDTTNGMLARLDSAVPDGTHLVILQPGGNDLRFSGTKERRTSNIDAMVAKLRARNIKTIVFDPVFPPAHYQWDGIHINAQGHVAIATSCCRRSSALIGARDEGARKQRKAAPVS